MLRRFQHGLRSLAPLSKNSPRGVVPIPPPRGWFWLQVRMVGGGGGGFGGGGGSAGTGGTGGNTTFGTSLLTANGGPGAIWNTAPVSGGTATISAPAIGTATQGGTSTPGGIPTVTNDSTGGNGCSSPFGGAGGGCYGNNVGNAAIANTGSGGGGGGTTSTASAGFGGGGSAGGYIQAVIPASLSATYAYAVGAAGTAGTAGPSGFVGGAGGSGYIEVTEHYV